MDVTNFLLTKDKKVKNDIAEVLYSCGCCSKCVLRFIGVKDNAPYSTIKSADKFIDDLCYLEDKSEETLNFEPVSKRRKLSTCTACLGILAELSDSDSITHVVDIINAAGYDSQSFLFSVSTPTCLPIRQLSILLHLKDKFPVEYGDKHFNDIPPVKEVYKWSFGPTAEPKLGKLFNIKSPLNISIKLTYADDEKDCDLIKNLHPKAIINSNKKSSAYKWSWSRTIIEQLIENSSPCDIKSNFPCPPPEPKHGAKYGEVTCFHSPIFLAGRYNKYSRQLSQTPWIIDGEKRMESSVQDLIFAQVAPNIVSDELVFSASGREDVDVRMLGKGRPFMLQVINPRQSIFLPDELLKLQKAINNSTTDIAVRDLQVVSKEETEHLKTGEEQKIKTYSALCISPTPLDPAKLSSLNGMKDIKLMQKTPLRVLHRRPVAVRERMIHDMSLELVDEHHFKAYLSTQAGTYIKEFVHGDFGRTTPNLRDLLDSEVDILELDVESIDLDWPPELKLCG